MPQGQPGGGRRGAIWDRTSYAAALLGGCIMLLAGFLIIASITSRWLFSTSIPGDIELIQAATAIAAFAFLPFGQISKSTIIVDTFTLRLSTRLRDYLDAIWDVLYSVIALLLSWRLAIGAFDAIRSHTVSSVIGLPIGWFMLIGGVMLFLLALTSLITAGRLVRGSS